MSEIKLDQVEEVKDTQEVTEEPKEMTMLEYVNSHFKCIKEAIDDNRNIIGMLDKMAFKEMCKLEAIVRLMMDKLNIKQEDIVTTFNDVIKEYQKDVDDMREKDEKAKEAQPKDVKDLSEEDAEEIRNKIKAEVTD